MSAVVVAGPGAVPARRRPPARDAIPFQGDVTAIELQPAPRWARCTILLVAVTLGIAFTWAAYAPIDKIVRAPGKLVTTEPKLVVAPLETAIIRSIDVKPGDSVRGGQVLAKLDPTFAAADTAVLSHRLAGAEAEIARLSAELEDVDYEAGVETPERRRELILFQQRRAERTARRAVFDKQAAEIQADLQGVGSDLAFTQKRLELAREVEGMRIELWQQQNNSKIQLLAANGERLNLEQSVAAFTSRKRELNGKLASLAASRAAYEREWVRNVAEALAKVEEERDAAREELTKADRRHNLVNLTAPEDAVVLEVSEHYSRGSVVEAAQPVFTLVPVATEIEAEAEIEAGDMGDVRVGDRVRVKLEAFPFQRHGVVEGTVRTITDDAFNQPQGAGAGAPARLVYRARIGLRDTQLRDVRPDFHLLPGMSLAAEIKVGERTVLSYILYPVIRGLDESLREP
jgi:hemolysin D